MKHPAVTATLLRLCTATALVLGCAWPAAGQGVSREKTYSTGELALLPEFCIDTQDGPYGGPEGGEGLNKSPRAREWVSKMGKDFWNMHHYCRALRDTARAEQATATQRDKDFLLLRAESDFKYIFDTCAPTMPLMPEALLRMGDIQIKRQQLSAGYDYYLKARTLKPDYWPAYTRWIDVQLDLKLYDEAKALAQEGLKAVPDNPELLGRLAKIEQRRKAATSKPRPAVQKAASAAAAASAGR